MAATSCEHLSSFNPSLLLDAIHGKFHYGFRCDFCGAIVDVPVPSEGEQDLYGTEEEDQMTAFAFYFIQSLLDSQNEVEALEDRMRHMTEDQIEAEILPEDVENIWGRFNDLAGVLLHHVFTSDEAIESQ